MDFRQLEYILMIDQEKNITHAAEKLYISQSALNQQLLKLEKELGCRLFHRSRTDWHATKAGEIYLDGARRALMLKEDTYKRINDVTHSRQASLKFGLTPGRGFRMFLKIYPDLHKKYPDLAVTPLEMNVRSQQKAVSTGSIDLGLVTLDDADRTSDHYIDLGREEFFLVIPRTHPKAAFSPSQDPKSIFPVTDLADFADVPFATMHTGTTNRAFQERIYAAHGIEPHIMLETTSVHSILYMSSLGLCCAMIPSYYLAEVDFGRCAVFALPDHPNWRICITYRKGSYLSDAAHTFIALCVDYWNQRTIPLQTN